MNISIEITPPNNFFENDEEGAAEEEGELEYAGVKASWLRKEITRLSRCALLKAHAKYIGAVTIQSNQRGWEVRKQLGHYNRQAVKIQKTWRGLLGRIRYFDILEETLLRRMTEHYHDSAALIQATFRGYYSRKYVHDQCALKKLQLQAARELLQCISIKACELLKNQQLPGVLSLRNSRCLSKVEKLLASLQLKNYNEEVRKARVAEVHKLTKAFEKSIRSREKVMLPFGPGCGKKSKTQVDSEPISYKLGKKDKEDKMDEKLKSPPLSDISLDHHKKSKGSILSYN